MISKDFFRALEVLAEDRGIEKEKILDVMGRGILNAYKKDHQISDNARIEFNTVKNEIILYADYMVFNELYINKIKELHQKAITLTA